jgi:hypothetical protein
MLPFPEDVVEEPADPNSGITEVNAQLSVS